MEYKGFVLDKFQEGAIKAIEKNNSVVVSAPTGSGKTLIADYIINKYTEKNYKIIYTAPIKALSNQKYKEFSSEYGKEKVGLLTGDIVINPEAPILIMTTEIYRNMALTNDQELETVKYVVLDEIHFINDIERGYVWEESIIFSNEQVRFLCLSATIPNAEEFAEWIESIKNHKVDVILNNFRNVPLERGFFDAELGFASLKDIKEISDIPEYRNYSRKKKHHRKHSIKPPSHVDLVREIGIQKMPCFFFVFSRQTCQKNALELSQAGIFRQNPKISTFARNKLSESAPEIRQLKSTKELLQVLPYGIAFHHAGLIPVIKELVEELFATGMIHVLYTTETFAVGINMPAKTVCFNSLRKFDGISFRFLNSKEYFQIAGRAGRRGIDKKGFAYAIIDRRDFDYKTLKKITDDDLEPIKSQFKLSFNTVLNIIKRHTIEEIEKVLIMSFYSFQKYGKTGGQLQQNTIYRSFNNKKKKLEQQGYLRGYELTEKGDFSSKIYSDEIILGEIFATEFYHNLNEFQILLILGCLVYEEREKSRIFKKYPSSDVNKLKIMINKNNYLAKEKRFRNIEKITGFIDPCYHGKSIFEILDNTNFVEGDLIRFFRQILDKIGQIKKATKDERLVMLLKNCKTVVDESMKDIEIV